MSTEQQWSDTDRGKTKYSENLSQCHFAHYTSIMEWPGTETVPAVRGQRLTARIMEVDLKLLF
jgi:hypothetical protein